MRTTINSPPLLIGLALLVEALTAHAITFTNDTLVSAGNTNFDGQDIAITNCTLTVDGFHSFASVRISNAGTLTHSLDTNVVPGSSGLNLSITENLEIDLGGAIDVSGKGFPGGVGPGVGGSRSTNSPYFYVAGAGGGYGGFGGSSATFAPGGAGYGSIPNPTDNGSGGGAGAGPGGAGGGSVKLVIGGLLRVDGRIAANGADGVHPASGGGAGGSVWVSAQNISLTGSVSANGGSGEPYAGGGGGGGRIAIYVSGSISDSSNHFSGSISAVGGAGALGGGAGTIFLRGNSDTVGQLLIDNGGNRGTNTPLNMFATADVTISGGALVQSASIPPIHNLVIQSNSWLLQAPNQEEVLELTITGNAFIDQAAGISGDAGGFSAGWGPGPGGSGEQFPFVTSGGGGYGGYGGASLSNAPGGLAYGSAVEPAQAGSGGGGKMGGTGGGLIRLQVQGHLDVRGAISVNGSDGIGPGTGGGSGGGLVISAMLLSGTGSISANGGAGESIYGGGGGGGRIAITFGTNQFNGTLVARGGAGAVYGGAGTIYLASTRVGTAQILVENGGWSGANTLLSSSPIPPNTSLTLSGGASALVLPATTTLGLQQLLITSNAWLTLPFATQQASILRVNLAGPSRIEAGGGINLDGKGNYSGQGEGGTISVEPFGYTGGGGSHGGNGGASRGNAPGGTAYDWSGAEPGSGGGSAGVQIRGAPGGGALLLTAPGSLVLDGRISADGADANTPGGGGGSGGSILLTLGALSGSGLISVKGGAGDSTYGGGGGGGRLIVYASQPSISNATAQFTGTFRAQGGPGFLNGGAGTINLSPVSTGRSLILVDNGGSPGGITPLPAPDMGLQLELRGAAVGSASEYPSRWSGLVLDSGAALIQSAAATNVDLTVSGDVYIGTNSMISADGKGYSGTNGGPGAGSKTSQTGGSGAGYGGNGGASASGLAGGIAYGSAEQPTDLGSRGGLFPILTNSSQGGGAIRLQITGTLNLNGKISANGNSASAESAGGGAGGSIWISTHAFTGTGGLGANGGDGDPEEGGGGGGGRIALYSGMNFFSGGVSAYGGLGANRGNNGSLIMAELPPLQIVAQSPTNTTFSSVGIVDVAFSSAVDPNSISNTSVTLQTPSGLLSPPNLLFQRVSPTDYQLTFGPFNTAGNYQVQVSPGLVDIFGARMSEAYLGNFTIVAPVISGHVIDTNNAPVPGVALTTYGEFPPVLTDTNGAYSLQVLPNWIGTITPSKDGWMFVPRNRGYNNLVTNADSQDFVMIASNALGIAVSQQQVNGNLSLSLFGINGVTYQAFTSTNLTDWQPSLATWPGSNQIMTLTFPIGAEPVKFFRLGSSY